MQIFKKLLYVLYLFNLSISFGQGGGIIDETFNQDNYKKFKLGWHFTGNVAAKLCSKELSTGKFLMGSGSVYNGDSVKSLIRLNENGSLDTTFKFNYTGGIYDAVEQADGKIVIVGSFKFNNSAQRCIARIYPDGTLDPSFYTGTGAYSNDDSQIIFDIEMDNLGRLVITGSFNYYNGIQRNHIVRLNPEGDIDLTFNSGSGLLGAGGYCIQIQPDNKIIVGGSFSKYNGSTISHLVRINENGSKDNSFNPFIYGFQVEVSKLKLQTDNKLLIVGSFISASGSAPKIARLNPNGLNDSTFYCNLGDSSNLTAIDIQQNGKIIVWRENILSNINKNNIIRLNSNGSIDNSFKSVIGKKDNLSSTTLLITSSDEIIARGSFELINNGYRGGLVKLKINGEIDTDFGVTPGFTESADGICCVNYPSGNLIYIQKEQQDGKILIGGSFGQYNSIVQSNIVRIFPNGLIDTSFHAYTDDAVHEIEIQSDGKILIGGTFKHVNGIPIYGIARLNNNGSIDTSFHVGSGITGTGIISWDAGVYAIKIQDDQKILVGGEFITYNGLPYNRFLRVNSNGEPDNTFQLLNDAQSTVYCIEILNSYIYVSGNFSSLNGSEYYFAKLKMNGSLHSSNWFFWSKKCRRFVLNPNGEMFIWDKNERNVYKINSDGSLNSNFNVIVNYNFSGGNIETIQLFPDGNLMIGGQFEMINNKPYKHFGRIFPNGNVDSTFYNSNDMKNGCHMYTDNIDVQINSFLYTNYGLLVGGIFNSYQNKIQNGIMKLSTSGFLATPEIKNKTFNDIIVYPNPSNGNFSIKLNDEFKEREIQIINFSGEVIKKFKSFNDSQINLDLKLNNGIYFIRIFDGNNYISKSFIINN